MRNKVVVNAEVFKGLSAVRESGEYNLLETNSIAMWLLENGYNDASWFILSDTPEYLRGVFAGFVMRRPDGDKDA